MGTDDAAFGCIGRRRRGCYVVVTPARGARSAGVAILVVGHVLVAHVPDRKNMKQPRGAAATRHGLAVPLPAAAQHEAAVAPHIGVAGGSGPGAGPDSTGTGLPAAGAAAHSEPPGAATEPSDPVVSVKVRLTANGSPRRRDGPVTPATAKANKKPTAPPAPLAPPSLATACRNAWSGLACARSARVEGVAWRLGLEELARLTPALTRSLPHPDTQAVHHHQGAGALDGGGARAVPRGAEASRQEVGSSRKCVSGAAHFFLEHVRLIHSANHPA